MAERVWTIEQLQSMIGKECGLSDWVEVTQEKIDRFAELTEDRQWIHVDAQRARACAAAPTA